MLLSHMTRDIVSFEYISFFRPHRMYVCLSVGHSHELKKLNKL